MLTMVSCHYVYCVLNWIRNVVLSVVWKSEEFSIFFPSALLSLYAVSFGLIVMLCVFSTHKASCGSPQQVPKTA